ncbi:somatostatin receptor type 5 [Biomphalaria glabrata]|nr:somatostatin receptor type 5 [Biomphalaria glabrata]
MSWLPSSSNTTATIIEYSQGYPDVPLGVAQAIDLIFGCFLIHIFALLGLVGTGLNVLILSRCNITSDSSNILLVSLSVADFLFCLTLPFSYSQSFLSRLMDSISYARLVKIGLQYCKVLGRIVFCTSITLVGVISAERCLVVYFPFKAAGILKASRIKFTVVCVYVINAALFSPLLYSFKQEFVYVERYQDYLPVILPSEFYKDNYEAINFEVGVLYNNAVLGSSMLLTLVATPATAVKLWLATNIRAKLTRRKSSFEPKVAKIFVIVCTVNLMAYGPFICFDTAINFLDGYSLQSNSYRVFVNVTDFSGALSACINFIIYVTMSKKFQSSYTHLFQQCRLVLRKNHVLISSRY